MNSLVYRTWNMMWLVYLLIQNINTDQLILGILINPTPTALRMSIDPACLSCLPSSLGIDVGPVEAGGGDQEEEGVHHHQYHAGQVQEYSLRIIF